MLMLLRMTTLSLNWGDMDLMDGQQGGLGIRWTATLKELWSVA